MDRRDFLKMSSMTALLVAGEWTGLSKVFAQSTSWSKNGYSNGNNPSGNMEYRKLGGLDVSAIGLGCLPMVGYYGGKYEKRDMIAPIPGTTNPAHLDDFLGAATARLTPYEMEEFDKEYARIDLMGHRSIRLLKAKSTNKEYKL